MHQHHRETVQKPEACAKWTLGRILRSGAVRTGALLAAAAFATLLTVDLPVPAGRAEDAAAQPYVPASGKWIELGPQRPATATTSDRLQADLLQQAGVADPTARPVQDPRHRS
jgi:hypothetical protein